MWLTATLLDILPRIGLRPWTIGMKTLRFVPAFHSLPTDWTFVLGLDHRIDMFQIA